VVLFHVGRGGTRECDDESEGAFGLRSATLGTVRVWYGSGVVRFGLRSATRGMVRVWCGSGVVWFRL